MGLWLWVLGLGLGLALRVAQGLGFREPPKRIVMP